ncbi:sensor histidine kinase [Chromatocurvus halotolerans]|uniref:histidine kinase n=1 Tax=Chromatocurvus halotolerans TaxID=1132028 RepID=A0A4R2LBD4_9GAMM|nr:ATP-binding protein [Chromatocurvus halotolerans]TCO76605.1 PAS/PAC sensor signal transduction histidine kinase [Chromatocurvus halotolerans]
MDGNHDPLESPYNAFNRLSEELSSAYIGLAERAAGLEAELARSRREKERQREEKEHLADRLAALLDSLPGGVVVYASEGCVTASNAVARDWFGADLQGRRWAGLLASGHLRLMDDGRELETAAGRQLVMSQRYVPGREETIVLLTDVTEERRLQAELEQNRRLATMGEMAARLAHQIRTPLATALLYANHLTDSELNASQRQGFGARLLARLRDLDRLTRDMLGFVRAAPGRPRDVALSALFDDVCQTLDAAVRDGRQLHIRDSDVEGVLRGDRQALTGALCNLIENAWQVGGPAVVVKLAARESAAGSIEIVVEDNGPGVDAEVSERIFEPFFSVRSGGTGLGLPLARSVAEAHQGSLRLEQRCGGGARFVLRLPLHAREASVGHQFVLAGDSR